MSKTGIKLNVLWRIAVVITILLAAFSGTLSAQAQTSSPNAPLVLPQGAQIVQNHYIVVYKKGFSTASDAAGIQSSVSALGGEVKFVYHAALNGYSAYLPAQALAAIRANPAVDYVAADATIQLDPENVVTGTTSQTGATWGLDRIDQHGIPLSNSYSYNKTGTGVNVYIIDTGIRATHVEFGGRATLDYDSVGDGQNGNDCLGHGTHVAGIVGSATYGVAKNVQLHAVRVFSCTGGSSYSQVIAGVDWVTANHVSPAVANMSLGGPGYNPLDVAVNNMINSGVVLTVSAGNSNSDACGYSPARIPNAITVGAIDIDDSRADYSNWGTCLDVFAPGTDITSLWDNSDVDTATISGTSMASPHVAGVAALYMEDHPNATALEVRNAIVDTSTRNFVSTPGAGSPNRLLYSLFGATYPIPDAFLPAGALTQTTPTFTWSQIPEATQYQFELIRNGVLVYTKTVAANLCITRICSNTPTNILVSGQSNIYGWRVRAFIGGVWKPYSLYKNFTIYKIGSAFNSQFVGTRDWTPVTGTWNIRANTQYHTTGIYGYVASSAHSGNYSTLDYQVSMLRYGCAYCANILFVRGNPSKLDLDNDWKNGYRFEYTNTQYISIWAEVDGYSYPLLFWTHAPMVKAKGFNTMRVQAIGNLFAFYINSKLVAIGIDLTLSYGQVGVGVYKDGSGGTNLYVDWAKLNPFLPESALMPSGLDTAKETVSTDLGPAMTNWTNPNMAAAP